MLERVKRFRAFFSVVGRDASRRPVSLALLAFVCASLQAGPAPVKPAAAPKCAAPACLGRLAPGYGGVVFTQLKPQATAYDGARLVLLAPDGSLKVLAEDLYSAADPEVSFDGKRILFSGKRQASDHWQIFEMQADGSGIRQITREPADCRHPIYQSQFFTLDAPGVWYQTAFVRHDADGSSALYSCRLDGSEVRRLTFNPYGDTDPSMLPDGRILFAGWQRGRLEPGHEVRLALFGINLDGTDYAVFSADERARMKRMPCITTDRQVVFVEPANPGWDGEGMLGGVTLRRNLHSYRKLTAVVQGLFHSPSPLHGGEILVARRASGAGTHGIWRFHPATKRMLPVFDDPKRHEVQPKLLYPREEPDGRSSVVDEKEPNGRLYCLSVYTTDLPNREWMPPGTVKRVRVIEGIPPRMDYRLLGEVNVEEDGSFNLQLPANTPFRLQTLDADGFALRTSAWIWVRNRESRGCIGCHEDGELSPENRLAKALLRPSIPLTLAPPRRRTVDFTRDVQPVLATKCSNRACHGGAAPPRLDDPATLAKYVRPGKARLSPLAWSLFDKSTARPWDGAAPPVKIRKMPPEGSTPLTELERRTIIEWIDLGARLPAAGVLAGNDHRPRGATGGSQ